MRIRRLGKERGWYGAGWRSRAPDAAQRFFSGALRLGPLLPISGGRVGPGSAQQRYTLRRVRDTRAEYETVSFPSLRADGGANCSASAGSALAETTSL